MAKNKKPSIRFKGFTQEWEQRKLKEMVSLITKGTTPIDKGGKGTVNFVKIENINSSSGEVTITSKITEEEHHGYLKRSQLREQDILFSIAGTLGRVAVVHKEILPANTNQALAIIRLIGGDNNYITTYLKGKTVSSFIKKNPTVGVQPNLSLEQVGNLEIALPGNMEQVKIGTFFRNLDYLITLHQQKHDKLQDIKKTTLQKMFPQNGRNAPEIRFKGFTASWKQCEAGKIFVSIADKHHANLPVLCASQELGMVKRDDVDISVFHEKRNEMTYKRVLPGQFVIHLRSFQGGFAHSVIEGITSPAYTVIGFQKPEQHNDYFWKYIFNSKEFIKRLETVTYGIRDGRSIRYDEFLRMNFQFPLVEEQVKISTYFRQLDRLITLHQSKLEKLQNIRKAFLEKMFI